MAYRSTRQFSQRIRRWGLILALQAGLVLLAGGISAQSAAGPRKENTAPESSSSDPSRPVTGTSFVERSSESFGTFAGVAYVRYTGLFTGETSLGGFRVPYEIVAPEDPGEGNGTVLMEPPHFTGGMLGRDRVLGRELLFGDGYIHASVGFGEYGGNILDPTASDLRLAGEPVVPAGPTEETGTIDEEILARFSEALERDSFAEEVLGRVERRYAYGVSQTASVLLELQRAVAGAEGRGLFDLTLLHVAVWEPPFPVNSAFHHIHGEFEPSKGVGRVLFVESEGDLLVSAAEQFREAVGLPGYRVYEIAGAAHSSTPDNPLDHRAVARALFVAGDEWVRSDIEPPPSTLLESAPEDDIDPVYATETRIARDPDGNARGGVRLPDLAVGRARFVASDPGVTPPGIPPPYGVLTGSMVDLACQPLPGSDTDAPRFRSHEEYVEAFSHQADQLRRQGFLLEVDADELTRRAAGSEVGAPGSCDENAYGPQSYIPSANHSPSRGSR